MTQIEFEALIPRKHFSYSYEVKRGNGRRFAIGDVHGCFNSLVSILQKIAFSRNDQLFLLGDCISKGKYPMKVLRFIYESQQKGFQIHLLRGNHEHNLLTLVKEQDAFIYRRRIREMGLHEILSIKEVVEPHYLQFLQTLPYFIELDTCFLVHAGFYFNDGNPFTNYEAMLTIRSMSVMPELVKNKFIIHGHTPVNLSLIQQKVNQRSMVINLDNGCAMGGNEQERGNLLCLNIDTFELFIQKNIDL